MTKWPYHADGETVRDYAGNFVAAAESERVAVLLAAAPLLYLYYKAVETVVGELRQSGSLDERQDNRIYTVREEVTKALANWSPT